MVPVVVALGLTALALGALLVGPVVFTVLVLALAVVALVDLGVLLGAAGARPVLPVALVPGLVLPAMVAVDVGADPAAGWDRIPGAFAIAFLAGFALVLLFGRRGGAVMGLAATAMAGLLVGLGASALLLLRGLPAGFRWVLALGVLVVAADAASPLLRAVRARRQTDDDLDLEPDRASAALDGVAPALLAAALAAGALVLVMGEPLEPLTVGLLAVVAVVSALGGAYLQRALAAEAGVEAATEARIGGGLVFGTVDAMVIAAPAAYVLARAVSL
jgi:hypothetical protein